MNKAVLIGPIITEKSIADAGKGKFTFRVSRSATKTMISAATAEAFSVHPVSVATTIVKGRSRRMGAQRREHAISSWKKAIVTLKNGEKIGLFDIGEK